MMVVGAALVGAGAVVVIVGLVQVKGFSWWW